MDFISAKSCHCSCVYCLEFPNGMKYVGKTKDLGGRVGLYESFGGSGRVGEAIKEFGFSSVNVSVLREVSCKDVVDLELCLSILEIKYIRELDTIYPKGLNVSFGGECLGIPIECITTDRDIIRSYNCGEKVVLCYDLNGDFVMDCESVTKFSYDNGVCEDTIRRCIGKMKPFADKWYLRYKRYDYIPKHIEVPIYEVRERIRYKDIVKERVVTRERVCVNSYKALKYDMYGNFCGEYENKSIACRSFLNNTQCGWGEYKKGFILFKKVNDNYPLKIEEYDVLSKKQLKDFYLPAVELEDKVVVQKKSRDVTPRRVNGKYTNINNTFRVAQCDLIGNTIKVFDNIRDASSDTGVPYSGIWACVMGRAKKAKGFAWKRYDEEKVSVLPNNCSEKVEIPNNLF